MVGHEQINPAELDAILANFSSALDWQPFFQHPLSRLSLAELVNLNGSGKLDRKWQPLTDAEQQKLVEAVTGDLRPGNYVEVGPGLQPRRITRPYSEESPYIGVDCTMPGDYKRGPGAMGIYRDGDLLTINELLQEQNPHTRVVIGDGKRLEQFVADDTAQEVLMGDVIISPGERYPISTLKLLIAARKALNKQTGVLVIGETDAMIPEFIDPTMRRAREGFGTLGILLDRAGFGKRLFLDSSTGGEAFDKIIEAVGWPPNPRPGIRRETRFVIAKPIAERPILATRGRWRRMLPR